MAGSTTDHDDGDKAVDQRVVEASYCALGSISRTAVVMPRDAARLPP
jgi:hypothetical protein